MMRASNLAFNNEPPDQLAEAAYQKAFAERKQDIASKENLCWLCCETRRFADARAILIELQLRYISDFDVDNKYSLAYSQNLAKRAQVELCAIDFPKAAKLFKQKLAYDQKFLSAEDPIIAGDQSNIASAQFLAGQTMIDSTQRNDSWIEAEVGWDKASAVKTKLDPLHQLCLAQNLLCLAQGRNDSVSATTHRTEVQNLRSKLGVKVPVVQF